MLKAINTTTNTVAANGTVPLTIKYNTNPFISLANNTITINKPGQYKISAVMNITANATTANIGLYDNGTLISETNSTITTTSGDEYQLVIDDIERVVPTTPNTTKVNLTLQSTTGFISDIVNVSVVEIR